MNRQGIGARLPTETRLQTHIHIKGVAAGLREVRARSIGGATSTGNFNIASFRTNQIDRSTYITQGEKTALLRRSGRRAHPKLKQFDGWQMALAPIAGQLIPHPRHIGLRSHIKIPAGIALHTQLQGIVLNNAVLILSYSTKIKVGIGTAHGLKTYVLCANKCCPIQQEYKYKTKPTWVHTWGLTIGLQIT